MEIGMIGLGRMGANMSKRLLKGGQQVAVFDRHPENVQELVSLGAIGTQSIIELARMLKPPRAIWLMIPSGPPIDQAIATLIPGLSLDDLIIDGGNSYYKDTLRRTAWLTEKKLNFVDVGTSGGVWGLTEGYSMMIGGEKNQVERLRPVFETLAPSNDKGWGHVGPNGAGHFVKMVHNGIEYGMMQAYAEGFSIFKSKKEFALDLYQIAEIWRHGSVVRSWLLDLTSDVFARDQELSNIAPFVADSGEGRWTAFEAVELNVPAPVITLSLIERLRSRDTDSFGDKILAVMRNQFGGHPIKSEKKE
jgi:6-phosphogluconate dehydrogenase